MRNIVGQTPRGNDFFPRPYVVNRIYRSLRVDAHIYLAAPRRVGKTAIMRHLEDAPQANYAFKYLITESVDNATTYCKVLLESLSKLKRLPVRSLAALGAFLGRINEIEVAGIGIGWQEGTAKTPFELLKELVKTLDTDQLTVVIMVDEFPQTVKNILQQHGEHAAIQFLQLNRELRAEVNTNIRFMLTGSIGLPTIADQLDATAHINDLQTIEIPPLRREEAQAMVRKLLDYENIAYDAAVVDHLLAKIEWFVPFHLQLLVQQLIDAYLDTQEPVNTSTVDEAFDKIAETRNDIYFAHYYSRLKQVFDDNNEHAFVLAMLHALAHQDELSVQSVQDMAQQHKVARYASALRTLEFDGYISSVKPADTWYRFTSPVLRLWWRAYVK